MATYSCLTAGAAQRTALNTNDAWLLGASASKVADILSCSVGQAKEAVDTFLSSLPELKKVKEHKIPMDASRGYFIGLDGRKVQCDSEHLIKMMIQSHLHSDMQQCFYIGCSVTNYI